MGPILLELDIAMKSVSDNLIVVLLKFEIEEGLDSGMPTILETWILVISNIIFVRILDETLTFEKCIALHKCWGNNFSIQTLGNLLAYTSKWGIP